MVSREHVESLVSLANLAAHQSHQNLAELIAHLPEDPTESRNLLLELLPTLIEEGANTASAAAELWYQQVRALQIEDSFQSVLGAEPDPTALEQNIRAMAQVLFDRPAAEAKTALSNRLSELVERTVKDGARSTILANALKDPAATRFARVPAGSETCAFCHMLASRGWVYATKESASKAKKTGDSFHAGCDCQIVPAFGEQTPEIEGYNPDSLYEQYLFAQREFEFRNPGVQPDDKDITATVRRLLPGLYQPGYAPDPGDIPFNERLVVVASDALKQHVLVGKSGKGGHVLSSPRKNKTKFPPWWSEEDIWYAVEDLQAFGTASENGALVRYKGFSRGIYLQLLVRNGTPQTIYPINGDGVVEFKEDGVIQDVPLKVKWEGVSDVYSHRFRLSG